MIHTSSKKRLRLEGALLVVGVVLTSQERDALAAEGARIAVAPIEGRGALTLRLGAELGEVGYVVVPISGTDARDGGVLPATFQRTRTVALLTIEDNGDGMLACVVERKDMRRSCRQVASLSEKAEDAAIATRAAELLRLLVFEEVTTTKSPQKTDVSATTTSAVVEPDLPPPELPEPSEAAYEVYLGPGVMLPNHSPAELAVGVGGSWNVLPNIALGIDAMVPLTAGTIERAEGTATVRATAITGHVDARYATGHWETAIGAGMGLLWLQVNGAASTPFQGVDDSLVDPFLQARGELSAFVTRSLAVRLDVIGGYTLSRAAIQFAGKEVAEVGRPLAMSTLSLALAWQ